MKRYLWTYQLGKLTDKEIKEFSDWIVKFYGITDEKVEVYYAKKHPGNFEGVALFSNKKTKNLISSK